MKNLITCVTAMLCSFFLMAQEGWSWPEDPELKSQAMEKQAYYKLLIAQSKYKEAMKPLNWLYENNPDLNTSIYIDGAKCIENVLENVKNNVRQDQLKDSVMWMFDQRIKYFDNDASTMDRKVYQAFQFYYKQPSKYAMLADLYEKAYEMNGPEISYFNLNSYMLLAKLYYQQDPNAMPAEKVLDIHTRISEIIDTKLKNGENQERLKKEQDKTDAWLSSIEGILTCDFIEKNLVPKFNANPSDLATAKKIFKYSVQSKCTDQPYFLKAAEPVYKEQPNFTLANAIGSRYLSSGDLTKGLQYYEEAEKLAGNKDEKFDAIMGQASVNSKRGNKTRARALAYEALSAKPGSAEAYNLIGNLYFTSFEDCKGGESKVKDRGVFLAAYEMYQKAGNSSQMQASKEQFPSIEEIFSENYEEGQSITVGCWINQTVTIKRR